MFNIEFPETDMICCRFPKLIGRNCEVEVDMGSKEYVYRLLPGMEKPKVGDFAVVSCATGFQVCVVTGINASTTLKNLAYVVGILDVSNYINTIEKAKRKEALYGQLQQKKKELEELVTWELLAEKSPEFKALFDAYNNL